jgi:tyrosine-specific transport protein
MKKVEKKRSGSFISAVSILTGTAIGAGILGLPYVISRVGLFFGIIEILVLGLVILLMNLYLGEVSLRTKGDHQLTGYGEIYFGKTGKTVMFLSMIIGIYAALIAYILAEGELLSFVFFGNLSHSFLISIIFWFLMTILVSFGISALGKGEKVGMIIILALIAVIILFFFPQINISNLLFIPDNSLFIKFFLPYGVIMFSLLAFSALPELEQILKRDEKKMKKAIILGTVIPIIVYLLFTISVVGFKGIETPEIGVIGLGRIPSLFGIFTIFTSFFALSYALRTMYEFDYKIKKIPALLLTSLVPLILFLLVYYFKLAGFIAILSLAGVLTFGLTSIIILIINKRAKVMGDRKPEYSININLFWIILLSIIFILGVIFEFYFYFVK